MLVAARIFAAAREAVFAAPRSNGNGGSMRWEALFADDRGEESLSRNDARGSSRRDCLHRSAARSRMFPLEKFRRCANDVLRRDGGRILQLGPTTVTNRLRRELIECFAAKTDRSGRTILISDGCQQAIDLVCKRSFGRAIRCS